MTEQPTWIREALAAVEARGAKYAADARDRRDQTREDDRNRLERQLERCGVPLDRATLTWQATSDDDDEHGYWLAAVDGYQFRYLNRGLVRLLRCPACQYLLNSVYSASVLGAEMGELLRAEQVEYHHCYGRPTTATDFDENGDLLPDCDACRRHGALCSTHAYAGPPPSRPPTTREALLLALDAYVEERLLAQQIDE